MSRKNKRWLGFRPPYRSRHHRHRYEPFYDEHSDYNTNAKSYYDYLARFNGFLASIVEFINRLMNRNIEVKNTKSINFTKKGDWIDNGECEPDNYDDVIELSAVVNISKQEESKEFVIHPDQVKNFKIPNGSVIKNDGLWSPDYIEMIQNLNDRVNNLTSQNNQLEKGLQKIVNNLYESGAITTNNINNFEFNNGRDIATGNINLFGGSSDGNSFIRTNKGKTNNDITAGY